MKSENKIVDEYTVEEIKLKDGSTFKLAKHLGRIIKKDGTQAKTAKENIKKFHDYLVRAGKPASFKFCKKVIDEQLETDYVFVDEHTYNTVWAKILSQPEEEFDKLLNEAYA